MKKVLLSSALAAVVVTAVFAAPVSAAYANPTIVAGARADSTGSYKNEIIAIPGQTVDMEMIVRNTTGTTVGLSADVNLPASVTLVPGSAKGFDSTNPNGAAIADSDLLDWKDLGFFSVYNASTGQGEAVVTYKVKVADAASLPSGAGVINIAHQVAAYDENHKTMTDTVVVTAAITVVSSITAKPTNTAFVMNGNTVSLPAYLINGNNYVKLRDVGALLADRFDVRWEDGKAKLYNHAKYTVAGGELASIGTDSKTAEPSQTNFVWGGTDEAATGLTAYLIGGNNYIKLRDIAKLFDFYVDWRDDKAWIEGNQRYAEEDEFVPVVPLADNFDVSAEYLSRIGISFGKLKTLLGDYEHEFTNNSRYEVWEPGTKIVYRFSGNNWTASDNDPCFSIQAPLGEFVPGMPQTVSASDFASGVEPGYPHVTIEESPGTAYYIADKYAQVYFSGDDGSGEEGSGFGAQFEIALNSDADSDPQKVTITRDSIAWLKIIAG
jgi:hypothetical protein